MKTFVARAIIFLGCVAIILIVLLEIPDIGLIVGRKKGYLEKNADKTYDLLVLGSSRAQHSFNPTLYHGNLQLFNAGEDGHGLPSNYLMFKVLVEKYHLKVNRLLLQVDEFSFEGQKGFSRQFRDDYFVTDLDDPEVFDAFVKYRGPVHAYALKFFPQLANLIYCDLSKLVKNGIMSLRKVVPSIQRVYLAHVKKSADNLGYVPVPAQPPVVLTNQDYEMEDDDVQYFLKLMALCRSHHIEVSLYRAPVLACQMIKSESFDHFIKSFCNDNNIKFFDYKCNYQWPAFYEDQNHAAANLSPAITRDVLRDLNIN